MTRAALFAPPLCAAAWAIKLEAVAVLAESLFSSGCTARLNDTAELRSLPVGAGGGDKAGRGGPVTGSRSREFAWAQGATALVLLLHAVGRSESAGISAGEGVEGTVRSLLESRADPGITGGGQSDAALHVAARYGMQTIVSLLLAFGADPLQRNIQGDTADAVAARAGRSECADLIRGAAKSAGGALAIASLTALEEEEELEQARLDRQREKMREKRGRQKERMRAQRFTAADGVAAGSEKNSVGSTATPGIGSVGDVDSVLSCDDLRAKISQVKRETARAVRQARMVTQRKEEERAKAGEIEEEMRSLEQQTKELRRQVKLLEPRVREWEVAEKRWQHDVQALANERDTIQMKVADEAALHAAQTSDLRSELEACEAALPDENTVSIYESENARRLAAEERCRNLEAEVASAPSRLGARLQLSASTAEAHRLLHEQQTKLNRESCDLALCLNQQLAEREQALARELDAIFGDGLPMLLQALQQEGVLKSYSEPCDDPQRPRRLWAALRHQ